MCIETEVNINIQAPKVFLLNHLLAVSINRKADFDVILSINFLSISADSLQILIIVDILFHQWDR